MTSYTLDSPEAPQRWPICLGAVGAYEPEILGRMAAAHDEKLGEVGREEGSWILLLDREAAQWREGDDRGLCWSEGLRAQERITNWEDASRRWGSCGLEISPKRVGVHSNVSGALPLYWRFLGEAIYFSSRIELLARGGVPLTVDWEAWSAIFATGFPIGDRTPFAEIKRLRPHQLIHVKRGKPAAETPRWPWAEVEPDLSVEQGLDPLLERMRASIEPLRDREVISALSGGWDSRLILALLMERPPERIRAFTVNTDTGREREELLAAEIAAHFGVEHEAVIGEEGEYWAELTERYRRSEYQRPSNAWLVTLADRLEREHGVVTDGLGLETLMGAGDKFVTEELTVSGQSRKIARGMWRGMSQDRIVQGLAQGAREVMTDSARSQFLAETEWLHGHPAQAILSRYWTRTLRGTTLAAGTALGCSVRALPPFVADDVAEAVLRVRPEEKFGGHLYEALFMRVDPQAWRLPSTHEVDPGPRTLEQRRIGEGAIAGYESALRENPLTPIFAPRTAKKLEDGTLVELLAKMRPHWRIAVIAMFGLWYRRYADLLGEIDPSVLLDGAGSEPPQRGP